MSDFTMVYLTCIFALFLTVIIVNRFKKQLKEKNYVKGPKGLPYFGKGLEFITDDRTAVFKKINKYCLEWDGKLRAHAGHHKFILVAIPEDIEIIMNDHRFLEKSHDYHMLRPWLQDGILTVGNKDKWYRRRKTLTPAFHFKILDEFTETFDNQANVLADILASKHCDCKPFDICSYINLYTLDVICETSMGVKINAQTDVESEYVKAVLEISQLVFWRQHHFLGRDDWYWNLTSRRRQHDKLVAKIHKFTQNVIENRRRERLVNNANVEKDEFGIKRRMALLDILLESTIDGKPLTNKDIHEEVDNFMFAGHDTTTSAIEFLLYNLAKYPEVQEKVYKEVTEVLGNDANTPISLSKLNDLTYLDLVIRESLRLYPSVPMIGRFLREDFEINGTVYPANHNVVIAIYMLHRDPRYHKDPLMFRPERFLELKSHENVNAYSYIPFSAGYRNCIGQKFAQYEIKTVISRLLQRFEIGIEPGFEPNYTAEIILRPVDGMYLTLKQRL